MFAKVRLAVISSSSMLLLACVNASNASDSVTMAAGQSTRFTQFELDIAFREDAAKTAKLYDPQGNYSVCCVVFPNDIKMLGKVLAHFKEHVSADVDGYGILVQEDEDHYIVNFWERYGESAQYQIDGFWHPGISEDGLQQYGYLVDRNTLEILEFVQVPK